MAKSKREFYELPNIATSSDIINAARHSIKAAATSRPFVSQYCNFNLESEQLILYSYTVIIMFYISLIKAIEKLKFRNPFFQTPSEGKRSLFTTRPTSSSSSIDLSELNVTPRVLSPIDSPKTQKRKDGEFQNFNKVHMLCNLVMNHTFINQTL